MVGIDTNRPAVDSSGSRTVGINAGLADGGAWDAAHANRH